jgi:hypothetical protein
VEELVEGVLAVRAGLSEHDFARFKGQRAAFKVHALAVGLHLQLLQVRREPKQGLRRNTLSKAEGQV